MSLILQGTRNMTLSRGLFLSSAVKNTDYPYLIKQIHSLEYTINSRVLNSSYEDNKMQGGLSKPSTYFSRYEKITQPVVKKRDEQNRKSYNLVCQDINSVTESPSFSSGLTCNTQKVNIFQKCIKKGPLSTFNYIANNTNPNYYLGIFRNLLSFFSTGALNQNCVFCSKAVDKNLAALTKGEANNFWVAKQTSRGSLPQNVAEKNYQAFVMKPDQNLSDQLIASTREGSRNIIMVPVKNKYFSHAMNLVRTNTADIVIDGQSGRTYDLSSVQGRQNFDKRYGINRALNVVQIYHTGQASRLDNRSPA